MRILMRSTQYLQHAGAELVLDAGQEYDLAAGVAEALVARGVAERRMVPPEIQSPKPDLETKRRRR